VTKKLITVLLSLLFLTALSFSAGCAKVEEKKLAKAPATKQQPAEEQRAAAPAEK